MQMLRKSYLQILLYGDLQSVFGVCSAGQALQKPTINGEAVPTGMCRYRAITTGMEKRTLPYGSLRPPNGGSLILLPAHMACSISVPATTFQFLLTMTATVKQTWLFL